jgi:hypothetical protein
VLTKWCCRYYIVDAAPTVAQAGSECDGKPEEQPAPATKLEGRDSETDDADDTDGALT